MPRIQHKRGTSANLASVNPTPLAGELVWDSTENAIKIGDGSTAWTSLAYVTATPRSHVHDGGEITTGTIDYARLPVGSTTSTVCAGDDARLSDARAPTAHKSTHATGGSDALTPADIGAAPAASPAITGNATFEASSGVPVTITNTGSGNSFVVNDASGDTTPFVVNADGRVGIGSSQTFGVPSRLHVADTGVSSTAVVTIQGTAAGSSASPLVPSSLAFRNFQFDTSAGNARQLFRIDALSREQAVATGAAAFYCSNASGVATEYFRIDPHLNGVISALPVVAPATTGSASTYVVSFSLSGDTNTGFGQVSGQSDTASVFTAGHERVRVDSSGRVGIGVTPTAPLHVKSSSGETLRLESTASGNGYVQFVNTSGSMSFGMTGSASNRVLLYDRTNNQSAYDYLGGASGVHRFFTNDTHRMSVKATGAVRFVPLSADPASGEAGDVYYNSSTNKLRVYNGTSWIDLH